MLLSSWVVAVMATIKLMDTLLRLRGRLALFRQPPFFGKRALSSSLEFSDHSLKSEGGPVSIERLACVCRYLPPGCALPLAGSGTISDFGLTSDRGPNLCPKTEGAYYLGALSNGPADLLGKFTEGLLKG